MKKLLLGLCLMVLGVACRAPGANMHDSSCTGKDCTGCTKEQMEKCPDCSPDGKAECQEKCEGEQVCPVTGKSMN
jgi:hypothetical protein